MANKYISNDALKRTQELLDQDARNSKLVHDAMTQLYEVEVGMYNQLSHYIETVVQHSGTNMPLVKSNWLRRTHYKGNYGFQDLLKDVPVADLLKIPAVQQGLDVIRQQNLESLQKLMKTLMDNVRGGDQLGDAVLVREIGKVAKKFQATGLFTLESVVTLSRYAKSLGIVSSAAIPIQIIDLLAKAKEMYKGEQHKLAGVIRQKADDMRDEAMEIEGHITSVVTDLSNLVLLINFIKKEGCDNILDSLMNMVLKEINKAKYLMEVLNRLQLQNSTCDDNFDPEVLEVTTVNCDGVIGWPIKELSMWIWCAWKLTRGSVILLQNTHFTNVPGMWTLFGVSIDCYGSDSGCGVSVLLPMDFSGQVESYQEFKDDGDAESNWNGRCIVVNIVYNEKKYSLVNMLAPAEKTDRELFIIQATKFVKRTATVPDRLICGCNYAEEALSMTLQVPKSDIPLSSVIKFLPCQAISQYLSNTRFLSRQEKDPTLADICVSGVCDSLNLTLPGQINWLQFRKPILSHESYKEEMKAILQNGMVELWKRKNPGLMEFSTASDIGNGIVTMTQTVHFFVSVGEFESIRSCGFDHTPRILNFTNHSAMSLKYKY